jgi:hypothetical protein
MTLTITADLITSDRTAHTARPAVGRRHAWLPEQTTRSPDREATRL